MPLQRNQSTSFFCRKHAIMNATGTWLFCRRGEGRESKQYTKNWNLKVNICPHTSHYFILQENLAIWTSPGLESGTYMVNAMQSKSIDKLSPIKALAPENMEINTYLKIRKSLTSYIKWVVSLSFFPPLFWNVFAVLVFLVNIRGAVQRYSKRDQK